MSRGLVTANQNVVDGDHVHEVILAKLEFTDPVYVHTGIGKITFDGDVYLGVGHMGGVSGSRESEALGPNAVTLTLGGLEATHLTDALAAGAIYDNVTLYVGYRQDDGTLVADPWIAWKGWLEHGSVRQGLDNAITLTCQHDLSVLEEKDGSRFTDEDQQNRYSGDVAFEFLAEMEGARLLWGGGPAGTASGGRGRESEIPIHNL